MSIAGIVLAGGQSSRYGKAKMFEIFAGQPLYEHSLQALKTNGLAPLAIATNAQLKANFINQDCQFIIEDTPHQGPLFALHQIMLAIPNAQWYFIIASDMPCMNSQFVTTLLGYVSDDYDVIMPQQGERLQPLAALYHRSALPTLQSLVQQNRRSMRALVEQVRVCYVPFATDDVTFININRQDDWQKELTNDKLYPLE